MTHLALDPWIIVEPRWQPDDLGATESLFAVANGFLGIRGSLDEGDPGHLHGTFLAGVHERHPLSHPEGGYGLPDAGQALIGVADGTPFRVHVDGVPLDFGAAPPRSHRRELDLRAGVLRRSVDFTGSAGGRRPRS